VKKTICAVLVCLFSLGQILAGSRIQASEGGWRVSKSAAPVSFEAIYRADLDALAEDDAQRSKRISLTVRCQNRKAQLLIYWRRFLGEQSVAVSHAIDGEPADSTLWDIVGGGSTSSLAEASVARFIRRMQDGRKLEVRVKPWRGHSVAAVFDLDGADSALADIRRDCN